MLHMLKTYIDTNWYREEGASGVEYAILIGIIGLALVAAALVLVPEISATFGNVAESIPGGA